MSSQKKRPVVLDPVDREELVRITTTGVHPASMIRRARVLLALAQDIPNLDHSTIGRVLKNGTPPSPEEVLDHSAQGQRAVRRRDGGRAGRLRPPS